MDQIYNKTNFDKNIIDILKVGERFDKTKNNVELEGEYLTAA